MELALAIIGGGTTALLIAFCITQAIWLHTAGKQRDVVRDLLDAEQDKSVEWEHKYNEQLLIARTSMEQRDREHNLRVVVEAQRDEAQRKCRKYLVDNLRHASNAEVQVIVGEIFAAPLSLVPVSKQPGNELMEPDL